MHSMTNTQLQNTIDKLKKQNAALQSENEELKRREDLRGVTRGLLNSDEKYKHLLNSNPLPCWIFDIETTRFLEVNAAAVKKYGYSINEFLAMSALDIRPKEDIEPFKQRLRNLGENDLLHHGQWHHIKKSGERIPVEVTTYLINYGGRTAAVVLSNDISERKKVEDILKNSELRFRSLIEKGTEIISLHDSQGKIMYMSPSIQTTLGYVPEERIGHSAFDAIHPDDAPALKMKLAALLNSPGSSEQAQWRHRHANGSWHWMEGVATNLLNDPAINAVVHNFRDITVQKEAESKIISEKELSESIINSLPGFFYLYEFRTITAVSTNERHGV